MGAGALDAVNGVLEAGLGMDLDHWAVILAGWNLVRITVGQWIFGRGSHRVVQVKFVPPDLTATNPSGIRISS